METRWEVKAELTQHISEILKEDGEHRSHDIEKITNLIPIIVTGENNEMMTKPIGM